MVVGRRQRGGPGYESAVALAELHPLQRQERLAQHRLELGDSVDGLIAGADRDDHDGNIDVATEEAGAPPLSILGAVDSEKD